jgi:hypothetical protein
LLSRGEGVEWTFKRNTACISGFWSVRNIILV